MTAKTATQEEPPWLQDLVAHGNFYRNCESHPSRFCAFYCINCMGRAFCRQCKSKHDKCGEWNVLRAFKAYGEVALRAEEMKTIWDISDISLYTSHAKKIVFIHKKGPNHRAYRGVDDVWCGNCSYRIKLGFKYCSIECMLQDIWRTDGETNVDQDRERKSCEDSDTNSTEETEQESESESE